MDTKKLLLDQIFYFEQLDKKMIKIRKQQMKILKNQINESSNLNINMFDEDNKYKCIYCDLVLMKKQEKIHESRKSHLNNVILYEYKKKEENN